MNNLTGSYIFENLRELYDLSPDTKLCVSKDTDTLCTVKKMPPECRPTIERVRAVSSGNPSLAKILFVKEEADALFVMSEYAPGETLSSLLKTRGTLSVKEAFTIASDVCAGLSSLHAAGLVHRDINPNNIVVDRRGRAVIIDYGIVRSFETYKNADTVILGTPGYAAPEQFGFTQSDQRTDVYAVGVLLNVMLTGAFPGEKLAVGQAGRIVRKCTSIDAGHRYDTIDDLAKALGHRETGSTPLDRFIKAIPGLRSKHVPVIILSVILYAVAVIFSCAIFAISPPGFSGHLKTFISWALLLPIPFVSFTDFLGIWDKLYFSKGAERGYQKVAFGIIGVVSIFLGLVIFGLMNAPSS